MTNIFVLTGAANTSASRLKCWQRFGAHISGCTAQFSCSHPSRNDQKCNLPGLIINFRLNIVHAERMLYAQHNLLQVVLTFTLQTMYIDCNLTLPEGWAGAAWESYKNKVFSLFIKHTLFPITRLHSCYFAYCSSHDCKR